MNANERRRWRRGLGQRIADAMRARGAGRASLAETAGLAPDTIGRYLEGTSAPRADTLVEIARALDVSAATLLEGGATDTDPVTDAVATILRHRPGLDDMERSILAAIATGEGGRP